MCSIHHAWSSKCTYRVQLSTRRRSRWHAPARCHRDRRPVRSLPTRAERRDALAGRRGVSAPLAEGVALARLVTALVRRIRTSGGQGAIAVPHGRAARQARSRLPRAVGDDGGLGLQLAELALQVGLQPAAVLTLEGAQLVDLALEERAFLLERTERLALLLLGLAHEPGRVLAGLADDAVALLLAVADVLVVQ